MNKQLSDAIDQLPTAGERVTVRQYISTIVALVSAVSVLFWAYKSNVDKDSDYLKQRITDIRDASRKRRRDDSIIIDKLQTRNDILQLKYDTALINANTTATKRVIGKNESVLTLKEIKKILKQ